MKKTPLSLATAGMLLIALFFTLSSDSKGHLSFFKKAEANVNYYDLYAQPCGETNIEYLCGPGTKLRCFPIACGPIM